MFKRVARFFWGELQGEELKKFLFLSAGAFCLVGSYWPVKPLKDSIFINMVGAKFLPDVKMYTVFVCIPLVLIYTKLVDYFSKQSLIYAVLATYSVLGLLFAYLLWHPTIGVANNVTDSNRLVAWGFYLFAETYLTMVMALFWSFINDITSSSSAKRGYGMVVFGSQLGGLVSSFVGKVLISNTAVYNTRVPLIICIAVMMFIALGIVVWLLTHFVDPAQLRSSSKGEAKSKVSFIGGIRVLLTHGYVAGIFGLIFFQEIVTMLMGFQLAHLVERTYAVGAVRTNFFYSYTLGLQLIACLFALFGTSYVHRRLGTRFCLIGFPFLLSLCAGVYLFWPTLSVVVLFMLLIKALHFALNHPVKESLYIPTSRNIKYRAKAWIDMFGLRFSKYAGSQVSKLIGFVAAHVGVAALAGLACWVAVAGAVGVRHDRAIRNKETID